jgi:hypothetical protein
VRNVRDAWKQVARESGSIEAIGSSAGRVAEQAGFEPAAASSWIA